MQFNTFFTDNFEAFSAAYDELYTTLNQKGGLRKKFDRAGKPVNGYYMEIARLDGHLHLQIRKNNKLLKSVIVKESSNG